MLEPENFLANLSILPPTSTSKTSKTTNELPKTLSNTYCATRPTLYIGGQPAPYLYTLLPIALGCEAQVQKLPRLRSH